MLALSSLTFNFAFQDKHSHESQSCRIQVSFQGFEWYMYNRTAAYDNIASALDPRASVSRPESRRQSEDVNEPRRVNTKSSGFAGLYHSFIEKMATIYSCSLQPLPINLRLLSQEHIG